MTFRQRFHREYEMCQWAIADLRKEYAANNNVPLLFINFIFGPMIALGMALWFAWKEPDV